MISSEFLLTSLVVVLVPGTGVIYTVSTGLFQGWRAGIAAAVGCTAGIFPHLLACILGLTALLHLSAVAFQSVKYAGVAYLFYLSWCMWRDTGTLRLAAPDRRPGAVPLMIRGVLINILNPKLSIFFFAFLPQFVPADAASPLRQMLLLSALFMAMTLVVFIGYGFCAHAVRSYWVDSPKTLRGLQRTFAAAFALLGVRLALVDR